ncbi:hypothetical protein V1522DRAFT_413272 [Lipomyces starkeyi]
MTSHLNKHRLEPSNDNNGRGEHQERMKQQSIQRQQTQASKKRDRGQAGDSNSVSGVVFL